jgi:predicted small lipoprotein YifL
VLFRINMDAGHGGKSGRFRRYRELSEMYAFLLDQLGVRERATRAREVTHSRAMNDRTCASPPLLSPPLPLAGCGNKGPLILARAAGGPHADGAAVDRSADARSPPRKHRGAAATAPHAARATTAPTATDDGRRHAALSRSDDQPHAAGGRSLRFTRCTARATTSSSSTCATAAAPDARCAARSPIATRRRLRPDHHDRSAAHAGAVGELSHLERRRLAGAAVRQRRALRRRVVVRDGAAQGPRFELDSPPARIASTCCPTALSHRDGRARLRPAHVPLAQGRQARDAYDDRSTARRCASARASMGNPHALIEVDDIATARVAMQARRCSAARVSRIGERRLRAGARARPHPPARVRARRRRNARLRQRRLRGRGDPDAARRVDRDVTSSCPAASCDRLARRRRPITMAGRPHSCSKGSGCHDRDDRKTRRARSRRLAAPASAVPQAVPGPRAEPGRCRARTARPRRSASYQLEVLRDKNRELSRRLQELFGNAQENERLAVRTHQLALALMRQDSAAGTLQCDGRVAAGGFPGRPGPAS